MGKKHVITKTKEEILKEGEEIEATLKKGIKATTIFAFMRDDIFDLWHAKEDVVESLEEKPLQEAFELTLKIIEELDK